MFLVSCGQEEEQGAAVKSPETQPEDSAAKAAETVQPPAEESTTPPTDTPEPDAAETPEPEPQPESPEEPPAPPAPVLVKVGGQSLPPAGASEYPLSPDEEGESLVYRMTASRAVELFSYGDEQVLVSTYTPADYSTNYSYSFWDTRTGLCIARYNLDAEGPHGYKYPVPQADGNYAMVPHASSGKSEATAVPLINPFIKRVSQSQKSFTEQSDYEKYFLPYANVDDLGMPMGVNDPEKISAGLKLAKSASAADGLKVRFEWPYPGEASSLLAWEPCHFITRATSDGVVCHFPQKERLDINLESLSFTRQADAGFDRNDPNTPETMIWFEAEMLASHPEKEWAELLVSHFEQYPGGSSVNLQVSPNGTYALFSSVEYGEGDTFGHGIGIFKGDDVYYIGKNGRLLSPAEDAELRLDWAGCSLLQVVSEDENGVTILVGGHEEGTEFLGVHRLRIDFAQKQVVDVEQWDCVKSYLEPLWVGKLNLLLLPASEYHYRVLRLDESQGAQEIAKMYLSPGEGCAIVLSNGHYAGTPGCESLLNARDGEWLRSSRAVAPWRNRPAEVLQALNPEAEDIAALQATTERWLRKLGFDPDSMPDEPSLSDLPHVEVALPPLYAQERLLSCKVTLHAAKNDISQLIVRANGVLIPQPDIQEDAAAVGQREVEIQVPLVVGQNNIEVTPVDSAGISGDSATFRTIYKGSEQSSLYVVAVGVSDYDDDELDLQFATKDATDISDCVKQCCLAHTATLLLTDKEVKSTTLAQQISDFLATAKEDDRVILYIAGHGMLDERLEYHFAPSDFNADDISGTGVSMQTFADCLQKCPARHRLLLLDTCHSSSLGERDMDKLAANNAELPPGVRAVQHRGMKVKKSASKLTENQSKRYIEDMFAADPAYRGINVIAASAGSEFAFESEEWNNGVFSASVMQTLKSPTPADTDENELLDAAELYKSVQGRVLDLTRGGQRPAAVALDNGDMRLAVAPPAPKENPVPEPEPEPEPELNSELRALISELEGTTYGNAALKLYQRRLLAVLPLIADGGDINMKVDTVMPKSNGTTALHNACGLGHYEIVKWLVENGADVRAKTAKGVSVETCIGNDPKGKIRALIKAARK